MEEENVPVNKEPELTKTEKAEIASHDVAEVAARALGRYYGGAAGGAAVDKILSTETGQKVLSAASKRVAKAPIAKGSLARNQENIQKAKPIAHKIVDNIGTKRDGSFESGGSGSSSINSYNIGNGEGNGDFVFSSKSKNNNKLIILLAGCFIAVVIFIVVLITPLISMGIIDVGNFDGFGSGGTPSYGYSDVSTKVSHWWPIGSSETTTVNGVTYASGVPLITTITSSYGEKEEFRNSVHNGIDISNGGNGPGVVNIIATKGGTVIYPTSISQISYNDNGYYGNPDGDGFGNYVKISHNDGTVTAYAHLSKDSITVLAGDVVKPGQVIGKMGNSGSSTGTHLHFEVRIGENRINPIGYVSNTNPRPSVGDSMSSTGASNQQSVCLALKDTDMSDNAISAILTNVDYQSSFKTGNNGDGFGIYQWKEQRYNNLMTSFPDSYNSINGQTEFLMYELENNYTDLYNLLTNNSSTAKEMTYNFCAGYGEQNNEEDVCNTRANNNDKYYQYVVNGCK